MKNILFTLITINLFLTSCELNDAGDTILYQDEALQLKWIGAKFSGSTEGQVFYKGALPSTPPNWPIGDWDENNNYVGGVWANQYECTEIVLYQSEGYFNYKLKGVDTSYVFTNSIGSGDWAWSEDTTLE